MNSLILIFLLCLINFNICDGNKCDPLIPDPSPNIFYLIGHNDPDKQRLNIIFRDMLSPNIKFKVKVLRNSNCAITVNDMIQYAEKELLLINLFAEDSLEYNINRLTKSLTYVRYPDESLFGEPTLKEVEFCRIKKAKKDGEIENCTYSNDTLSIYTVKLASNTIEKKNNDVFQAILEFGSRDIKQKVVDCNPQNEYYNRFFSNNFNIAITCEVEQDVFVVLAPKPIDVELPTDIPIVFYDESYLTPETKDDFPNAITTINTDTAKKGLLLFLQKMEWYRIAIITDDSENNRYFEEQLTPYLRDNGVSLISETCMSRDCNFDKILETLDEINIKIIIANIDEKNAKKVKKSSVKLSWKKWIVRDWSSEHFGDMFIMSSIPSNKNATIKALNAIMETGKYCKYCKYNNRVVAHHLQEKLFSKTSYKFTRKNSRFIETESIGFVSFKNGNLIESQFTSPYSKPVSDGIAYCTIKVQRIHNPCDDNNLLLLLLIIAMFCVTLLGIVYFFQSPIISYQRFP